MTAVLITEAPSAHLSLERRHGRLGRCCRLRSQSEPDSELQGVTGSYRELQGVTGLGHSGAGFSGRTDLQLHPSTCCSNNLAAQIWPHRSATQMGSYHLQSGGPDCLRAHGGQSLEGQPCRTTLLLPTTTYLLLHITTTKPAPAEECGEEAQIPDVVVIGEEAEEELAEAMVARVMAQIMANMAARRRWCRWRTARHNNLSAAENHKPTDDEIHGCVTVVGLISCANHACLNHFGAEKLHPPTVLLPPLVLLLLQLQLPLQLYYYYYYCATLRHTTPLRHTAPHYATAPHCATLRHTAQLQ
eukprot:360299-Chlamydomonas_euryale.AAC.8